MATRSLYLAAAFLLAIYPRAAAAEDKNPESHFVCGTPDIEEELYGPRADLPRPERKNVKLPPPPPVTGNFFYQGFLEGNGANKLPLSMSLSIKDNDVRGTGILEGKGQLKITGKVLSRGMEMHLTTPSQEVIQLTTTLLGKTLRGRLVNRATNERWQYKAELGSLTDPR